MAVSSSSTVQDVAALAGVGNSEEVQRRPRLDDVDQKAKGDAIWLDAAAAFPGHGNGGVTWLHVAAAFLGHRSGDMYVANLLLECEDKNVVMDLLKASTKIEDFTALHIAASVGGDQIIKQLLDVFREVGLSGDELEMLINARDCIGRTPLHHAAWMQRGSALRTLLSCEKINVNAKDRDMYTPLHLALMNCNADPEVIGPLLEHRDIVWNVFSESSKSDPTKRILLSKQEEQNTLWGRNSPLPRLSDYVFEEPRTSVTPVQLIVRLEKPTGNLFEVLNTVWELDKTGKIMEEIEKQLKLIVKSKSKEEIPEKCTVMHLAAFVGLPDLMRFLIKRPACLSCLNAENVDGQTPLHWASLTGQLECVHLLNEQPALRGAVEDNLGQTPLEIAYELEWEDISRLLLQRQDVKDYVSFQHAERSVYVDGTNAVLVGAALIASITFAGWLQPPLGYQPYYQYLRPDAPPDTYEQYAAIDEHTAVKLFWIFNSLSFYCAIASLLAGAGAVVPRSDLYIRAEVKRLGGALYLASFAFSWAVVFIVGAFAAAGFASLPPMFQYEIYMIVTLVLGMFICYHTFSSSRSSNPSFFLRYSKFIDPGFYLSTSISYLFKRCFKMPLGYESVRERREKRRQLYRTAAVLEKRGIFSS